VDINITLRGSDAAVAAAWFNFGASINFALGVQMAVNAAQSMSSNNLPDRSNAHGTSSQQTPSFDTAGIKERLKTALDDPECANFVKQLLNAVAKTNNPLYKDGDVMKLFDSFVSQTKGGFTREKPAGSAGYGNASGLIAKGDASIFLYGDGSKQASDQTILDTMGTLHELLHLAGAKSRYTDRAFAEVVRNNPEWSKLSRAPYPGDKNFGFKKRAKNPNDGVWSSYWGDVLNQKCFEGKIK
jgi:hypothetical protein